MLNKRFLLGCDYAINFLRQMLNKHSWLGCGYAINFLLITSHHHDIYYRPRMNSERPLRLKSSLVATYSWDTSALYLADLVSSFHGGTFQVLTQHHLLGNVFETLQQELSEKIISIESLIASSNHGDGFSLRQFLGFERDYTHLNAFLQAHADVLQAQVKPILTSLSAKNRVVLNMLFLSYRVMDIAASLEGYPRGIKYEKKGDFRSKIQVSTFLYSVFSTTSQPFSAI